MGRSDLQALLETLTPNVYFQPPSNVLMVYPAIVYERSDRLVEFANNLPYRDQKRYMVTVIDRDPDSMIPDAVAKFPLCVFNRAFRKDGLNHDVFMLYF